MKPRHQTAAPQATVQPAPPPAWLARVGPGVIAVTALALAAVALGPHRVGDYYTETDFYGGYAEGARQVAGGVLDPARYGVSGPLFDVALAAVGAATRDLFVAGEIVSILSTLAALFLWFRLLRVRAGLECATWAVAFLAANAVLFRHGYSATTDALALGLAAAALHSALARRGAFALLLAGTFAGLATLTRYSMVALLPAVLFAAWRERERHGVAPGRGLAIPVAGFAIVVLPFVAWSLRAGHFPGEQLFHDVAYDVYATGAGRTLADYQKQTQPGLHSLAQAVARDPLAVLGRQASNLLEHVRRDGSELLGWPLAALAALGLLRIATTRGRRLVSPLALAGVLSYLALVPAPYSPRYSLALAPFYCALAGAAIALPRREPVPRALGRVLPALAVVAGLATVVLYLVTSVRAQRETLALLPVETISAARALRLAPPGERRVMALKPHVAYLANAPFEPMPAGADLTGLAAVCARDSVRFLYYSWIEANNRPENWYLLEPGSSVAGLETAAIVDQLPAVLYRLHPGFGPAPAWLASDSLRATHEARFIERMPAELRWRAHLTLAVWARSHGKFAEIPGHIGPVLAAQPRNGFAWRLLGDAEVARGDREAATVDFARAVAIDPSDVDARVALGWMRLAAGDEAGAAREWRPVVENVRNAAALARMAEVFRRVGDAASESRAHRAALRLSR